ncbi:Smr/MutS family protein [Rhodopila sp.]|uniref:Smr/MutS family protein n=1 Tax=Rhodopila sp. TaxID=2480087 RepID=UPI003D0E5B11
MPPRTRGLTAAEQALWANYASQIAPLRSGARRRPTPTSSEPAAPAPAAFNPPRPPVATQASKPRMMASPLTVGTHPGGIDSATWQRFRSGKLAVARTLDLHGMTTQRAFHALVGFLRSAHADRLRCVEVVTGRGSGETGGVIRREFPHWLNLPEVRPLILGAAHPHVLNPGSVRLILRRIR